MSESPATCQWSLNAPAYRPITTQTVCTGSSPIVCRRCGIVDSNEIESPASSTYSSNPTVMPSVPLRMTPYSWPLCRTSAPSRLEAPPTSYVVFEKLDLPLAAGGQPLPAHAALELDRRPLGSPLDEHRAASAPDLLGRPGRALGTAAGCPGRRRRVGDREHLVERDAELAHDRVQRPHRRLDLRRLDLRDEARRDLQPPRQLAQAQALLDPGVAQPRAQSRLVARRRLLPLGPASPHGTGRVGLATESATVFRA